MESKAKNVFWISLCCHVVIVGFFTFIDILMMKDMVDNWEPTKECNTMAAWMTAITSGYGIFLFAAGLVVLFVCKSDDYAEH